MNGADDLRAAIGDDLRWRILTSDEDGREAAIDWLRAALTSVRTDRKIRKAQSVAERAATIPNTREWHEVHARFAQWEARSRGFEKLVLRRLRELGLNEQGHRIDNTLLTKLERAQRHAQNCERQMRHAVQSLADLASLVEAHVAGNTTREELDQALDDLTVASHGDEEVSLRVLLAGKRAAYAEPA